MKQTQDSSKFFRESTGNLKYPPTSQRESEGSPKYPSVISSPEQVFQSSGDITVFIEM